MLASSFLASSAKMHHVEAQEDEDYAIFPCHIPTKEKLPWDQM